MRDSVQHIWHSVTAWERIACRVRPVFAELALHAELLPKLHAVTQTHHAQGAVEELWKSGHPEVRPQHTAMHEKLAAVFSCISAGAPHRAPVLDKGIVARFRHSAMLCRPVSSCELVCFGSRAWAQACAGS